MRLYQGHLLESKTRDNVTFPQTDGGSRAPGKGNLCVICVLRALVAHPVTVGQSGLEHKLVQTIVFLIQKISQSSTEGKRVACW